ncbi:hypothetical protein PXH78_09310 [Mycolicibacterium smegmatis]|nr:hypothetical protein [Mycolicibacterium smegmatis]
MMSFNQFWENQAFNTDLTLWQRVFAFAMSRHLPNLHTPFEPGQLEKLLGVQPDGTVKTIHRQKLWEAINHLKKIGWLDQSSDRECLVLPAEGFATGMRGNNKPCPHHCQEAPAPSNVVFIRDRSVPCSSPNERESNRDEAKRQAREVLRPEKRDMMSPKTGQAPEVVVS